MGRKSVSGRPDSVIESHVEADQAAPGVGDRAEVADGLGGVVDTGDGHGGDYLCNAGPGAPGNQIRGYLDTVKQIQAVEVFVGAAAAWLAEAAGPGLARECATGGRYGGGGRRGG